MSTPTFSVVSMKVIAVQNHTKLTINKKYGYCHEKKVALKYHTNKDLLLISPELDPTDSKYRYRTINIQYESSKNFYSLA